MLGGLFGVALNAWAQEPTVPIPLPGPDADPWAISLPHAARELGLPVLLAWVFSWLRTNGGVPVTISLTPTDRDLIDRLTRAIRKDE